MKAVAECKKFIYELGELIVEKTDNEGKPSIKFQAGSKTLYHDFLLSETRDRIFAAFKQWEADIVYRSLIRFTVGGH